MNTTMTANMYELQLHDLEQVAGGGEFRPNLFMTAAFGTLYLVPYTVGYFG